MSLWRAEASKRLPELQSLIASPDVDNPMILWIELQMKFQDMCAEKPLPLDIIKRVWEYAKWCMVQGHPDVTTAVAYGFCEHLLDRATTRNIIPQIMTREDYENLKVLLINFNSEGDFTDGLKLFEKSKRR